ncbi:transcription factor TFIIE, putative [Theileria annulata]|uniref:Transcription factor TFIIE, putative n=1 Tax=Theileria annulata TaxID=5874 RepID=Q4UIR5_THEAN|nr:transcription factor TFIIE, putative [Theileria annulata]CAI73024.2 transcription factor TFIIE, putative [Theileria annulata]|eukprot:XP_953702.1 transcription factor TFIIE, putative [Theileria annulata]
MFDTTVSKGQSSMPNMAGEINKKSYDKETFSSLLECCTRLFFCDEEIVIVDLFLATERAISEKDLEDELGLPENRLREHLSRLERHGILTRFSNTSVTNIFQKPQRAYKKDSTRESSSTHTYWRINNHVIIVIHYKLTKMEEILQQKLKGLYESDKFICPKCESTYDSLTVQTLEMDGFDAHFICKCGTKVELDDRSAKEDIYSSQHKRFQEQVKNLKKCLYDAWGMEVPEFPVFVKKHEKLLSETKTNNLESSSVVGDSSSVVGGGSSVVSDGSESAVKKVPSSIVSVDRGKLDSSFGGRTDNKKIKFHMKVGLKGPSQPITSPKQHHTKQKEKPKEDAVYSSPVSEKSTGNIPTFQILIDVIPDFYISSLNKTVTLIGVFNHCIITFQTPSSTNST